MLRNLLVLPDGTEIFSGTGTVNALKKVQITQRVNAGSELTLGSVCANMLEADLITPGGDLHIAAGSEVTLYKVDESGVRTKVGLFTLERPTRPSANTYKITAYDRVSWLDKDLTQWLSGLNGWPYSLYDFANMVCMACGLTLGNTSIPNGLWQIQKFFVSGITGRQLLQWVGQACGRFCRATADGVLEFAWYTPKDITVTPDREDFYFLDGLQFEDYLTAPVDKVQIRLTDADIGAVYGTGNNAYIITGNYLLTSDTLAPLQAVAQEIYRTLQGVTYTPCKVTIPASLAVRAGDIIQLTDRNGTVFPMYVMTKVQTGQRDYLECTGSMHRNSTVIVNSSRFEAVGRKVTELQIGLDGLELQSRDMNGNLAGITMELRGISSEVAQQNTSADIMKTQITEVAQAAEGLSVRVQEIQNGGVDKVTTATGYTFNKDGLRISKSGQEMENLIDNTGMYVKKDGGAVLTANDKGVDAKDLKASTYLMIGENSRFENMGNRTACFWIGG